MGVKKKQEMKKRTARVNKEEWEKSVFTSAEKEALMSPSAEWRAQNIY